MSRDTRRGIVTDPEELRDAAQSLARGNEPDQPVIDETAWAAANQPDDEPISAADFIVTEHLDIDGFRTALAEYRRETDLTPWMYDRVSMLSIDFRSWFEWEYIR